MPIENKPHALVIFLFYCGGQQELISCRIFNAFVSSPIGFRSFFFDESARRFMYYSKTGWNLSREERFSDAMNSTKKYIHAGTSGGNMFFRIF